jgi:hypothetical protein
VEAESWSTTEGFAAVAADKTDIAFPCFHGEHTMIAGALGALAKARGTFGSGIRLARFV